MLAKLIPIDGDSPITISRDVTVVGRSHSLCDLVIDQTSVSKLQCIIAKTDGLLFIRDLGSTNGTRVNGQRITRGALLPGDELAFASVKYRVHLGPSAKGDEDALAADERTEFLDEGKGEDEEDEEYEAVEEAQSSSDVRFLDDSSAT